MFASLPNYWSHNVENGTILINKDMDSAGSRKTDMNKNIFIIHIDKCSDKAIVNASCDLVTGCEMLLIGYVVRCIVISRDDIIYAVISCRSPAKRKVFDSVKKARCVVQCSSI